ncbi:MAG: TfoX/Sxy family protein [Ignavibacteria bacterium]|nr:TfoX/Sxy family protein [Ignavibacteria bacterium]
MPYSEHLAGRVRSALKGKRGITEKKMFGGLSFLHHGNMCVGIIGDDLMVRVGPAAYKDALSKTGVRPMDFTGRPLNGYVYVSPAARRTGKALGQWVARGLAFTSTLRKKG